MLLSRAGQLQWHDEWRNRIVALTINIDRGRMGADAEPRYGVCLAVINGTFATLAIVEIPENGPNEPRRVLDLDITHVSRIGSAAEHGDTRDERTIMGLCLRDGEFKVRFQDDLYQPANQMHAAGLLFRGAVEKSPTGFTYYTLTQLGRATALMRGIRP